MCGEVACTRNASGLSHFGVTGQDFDCGQQRVLRHGSEVRSIPAAHLPRTQLLFLITYSVFRLAARRTNLCGWIPRVECAPVSEKRVGLNRSPRRQGYGR